MSRLGGFCCTFERFLKFFVFRVVCIVFSSENVKFNLEVFYIVKPEVQYVTKSLLFLFDGFGRQRWRYWCCYFIISSLRRFLIILHKIYHKTALPCKPIIIKKLILWFYLSKCTILICLIDSWANRFLIMTVSHSENHPTTVILITRLNEVDNFSLVLFQLGKHVFSDFQILDERILWCTFLELLYCVFYSRRAISSFQTLGDIQQMAQG